MKENLLVRHPITTGWIAHVPTVLPTAVFIYRDLPSCTNISLELWNAILTSGPFYSFPDGVAFLHTYLVTQVGTTLHNVTRPAEAEMLLPIYMICEFKLCLWACGYYVS